MRDLLLNAHHHGSLPQQLEVVWSLLLQAGFEGPSLISHTVWDTQLPKKRKPRAFSRHTATRLSWKDPRLSVPALQRVWLYLL